MLFSEWYKIMVNKFTFIGFRGVSASAETRVNSISSLLSIFRNRMPLQSADNAPTEQLVLKKPCVDIKYSFHLEGCGHS